MVLLIQCYSLAGVLSRASTPRRLWEERQSCVCVRRRWAGGRFLVTNNNNSKLDFLQCFGGSAVLHGKRVCVFREDSRTYSFGWCIRAIFVSCDVQEDIKHEGRVVLFETPRVENNPFNIQDENTTYWSE